MTGHRDGIILSLEDGIARITLSRPDAGNAITLPLAKALLAGAGDQRSTNCGLGLTPPS
ncbi:hypothetical protein [Sphingobium sp.]|uniref:hypothetical protein n=1 Tax=Sphingobium sp. TaxID=1912891 RepID=UPI0035C6996B